MSKCRFLLLVVAFFIIMGGAREAQASTNASPLTPFTLGHIDALRARSCLSALVSIPLRDELLTQTCLPADRHGLRNTREEIQSSLIISSPKEPPRQTNIEIQPQTFIPTSIPIPTQTEPTPQVTNLDSDRIFDLINKYRTSQGLAAFERDEKVCKLAQARSIELGAELNNGTIHSGLYKRDLPYWIFENAKVGSSEDETVAWWLSSPLHHESIVGDYKFSCVKCTGLNCSQLFTSFTSK